jgi:hypothetical protein
LSGPNENSRQFLDDLPFVTYITVNTAACANLEWKTKEPLEQAERQAQWLAKWATSAIGDLVTVVPVLALPGWFVQQTGRSPVQVYSGRALSSLLNAGAGKSRQGTTHHSPGRTAVPDGGAHVSPRQGQSEQVLKLPAGRGLRPVSLLVEQFVK